MRCVGLSLSRPLLLRSTSSRRTDSVVVAHGPSCSVACGIFPDRGSNACPLHWQADSQSLRHQGSPGVRAFIRERKALTLTENQVILTENHCEFQLESVTSKNLDGNLSSEPFPGRKQVIPCHALPNKKGADLKERHGCEHLKDQDNAYTPLGTSQGPCVCSMMVGLKGACPKNSSNCPLCVPYNGGGAEA